MSLKFSDIAKKTLEEKGIEATKERVDAVVASVRIAGVNPNDESAVKACTEVAVKSSMKFDWSKFKKPQNIPSEVVEKETITTGVPCPRCGKPTVYANIYGRRVAYCTSGCNIAVPFAT